MGLQAMGIPDPANRRIAHSKLRRHRPCAPVSRLRWGGVQGRFHHRLDYLVLRTPVAPAMRRILRQADGALLRKAFAPQQHRRAGHAQLPGNRVVRLACGSQQTNARTKHDSLCGGLGFHPRFQGRLLLGTHRQGLGWLPHASNIPSSPRLYRYYCNTTLVIKRVPSPVTLRCRQLHSGNMKSFSVSWLGENLGKMLPSVTQGYRLLQVVYLLVYPTVGGRGAYIAHRSVDGYFDGML